MLSKKMFGKIIKCEHFVSQNNEHLSESITQSWTEQAIECWQLNQKCSGCSIGKANYSFECQMYKVVKVLLKTLGEPSLNNKSSNIKETA